MGENSSLVWASLALEQDDIVSLRSDVANTSVTRLGRGDLNRCNLIPFRP